MDRPARGPHVSEDGIGVRAEVSRLATLEGTRDETRVDLLEHLVARREPVVVARVHARHRPPEDLLDGGRFGLRHAKVRRPALRVRARDRLERTADGVEGEKARRELDAPAAMLVPRCVPAGTGERPTHDLAEVRPSGRRHECDDVVLSGRGRREPVVDQRKRLRRSVEWHVDRALYETSTCRSEIIDVWRSVLVGHAREYGTRRSRTGEPTTRFPVTHGS